MRVDNEKRILELLKENPQGLTITQICYRLNLHRVSVLLHLHKLISKGLVIQREVGPAKLNYYKNHFPSKLRKESEDEKRTWEEI